MRSLTLPAVALRLGTMLLLSSSACCCAGFSRAGRGGAWRQCVGRQPSGPELPGTKCLQPPLHPTPRRSLPTHHPPLSHPLSLTLELGEVEYVPQHRPAGGQHAAPPLRHPRLERRHVEAQRADAAAAQSDAAWRCRRRRSRRRGCVSRSVACRHRRSAAAPSCPTAVLGLPAGQLVSNAPHHCNIVHRAGLGAHLAAGPG